jgi:hypothetical protein
MLASLNAILFDERIYYFEYRRGIIEQNRIQ